MINEKYIDLVTAYLRDELSPKEQAELNELIDQGDIDLLDLKEMEVLYKKTGSIPAPEPSEGLRSNFYQMLNDEKARRHTSVSVKLRRWIETMRAQLTWRQLAGTAVVFVMGLLVGNWATHFRNYNRQLSHLNQEVTQMRQVVALNLINDASPTERLKAVNISMDLQSDNHRLIAALLKTLNNDPNINVRLAAVEALIRHGNNPAVRQGLVRSIENQQSPLVQASLADAMLALQETHSVEELKMLLNRDNLDPSVQQKVQHTIQVLS